MKTLIVALATGVLVCATASATLVYNNGGPDQGSADDISDARTAEDFTIAGNVNLTSFEFWNVQGVAVGDYKGSISWFLFTDSGGIPDTLLAQGSASTGGQITRTSTGISCCPAFNEFDNLIDLTSSVTGGSLSIGAGTYWFAVHDGDLSDTTFTDFYWETTNPGGGAFGRLQDLTVVGGSWDSTLQEHAFNISGDIAGVPEPASYGLLTAGLIGMAYLGRRKAIVTRRESEQGGSREEN